MGKNAISSRRKLKKMEKSKVKIKTSKTLLPKGQNVTDTNFKVKKIIIKDQVRQHDEDEILSKKKLSCKELVSRLTHHSVSMKLDSLMLLKQLITDHSEEVLQSHLALLIESVPKLILDETREIRKEANKLLALILSVTSLTQLVPLFPLMNAYLICGLTHIDVGIREDSLFFLDVLLQWTPKLCADSVSQLLPICLDLVSSSTSTSRALTLNLDSKLTARRWRGNVLARISLLLSILLDSQADTKKQESISVKKNNIIFTECIQEGGKTYIPINSSLVNYNFDKNRLFPKLISQTQEKENFNLKDYLEALIPLLFQAFIEMVPADKDNMNDNTSTIISPEVSMILKHMLDIMTYSWELLQLSEENWFKYKFKKSFMNSMVTGRFPYTVVSPNDMTKAKKNKTFLSNDEFSLNCQTQNIMLIKFILLLTDPPSWTHAISYLKDCFRSTDKLSSKDCSLLISCCKIVVTNSSGDTQTFLGKLNKLSRSSNPTLASQAISALHSIAMDTKYSYLHEDTNFQLWLEYLPEIITERALSQRTLGIIYDIARRNFPAFSTALDGRIEYIMDQIPEIMPESGSSNPEEIQIKIAQLLYWVKDWDDEMIQSLRKGIDNKYWGDRVTSHVKDVFELKFVPDSLLPV